MAANIEVEITDISEFHCFKLVLNPQTQPGAPGPAPRIEIMLHASALVDLIHKCSLALSKWQQQTVEELIQRITGLTGDELRERGLIA